MIDEMKKVNTGTRTGGRSRGGKRLAGRDAVPPARPNRGGLSQGKRTVSAGKAPASGGEQRLAAEAPAALAERPSDPPAARTRVLADVWESLRTWPSDLAESFRRMGGRSAGGGTRVRWYHRLLAVLRRCRRRWQHIVHEKRARRFPESERAAVLLLLFAWGMLPMLGGRIRESTWGRRKRSIGRFGRVRAWMERKKTHPAAFLAMAGTLAVAAVFFSLYTFGTTVIYDGEVVASVTSRTAVQAACSDLEKVTASTLGTAYSINENLIQYTSGLLSRKDVVDEDAFEEDLSDQIGLVTYAYALYVNGELIGATPYQGALEELLQQSKDGISDENTISCTFQEDVEIKPGYVPTDKVMNLGYIAEKLYSTKTEEKTYTVTSGDTWSQIAEKNDMTSAQLLAMNPGYDIDKISIGEVLAISAAVPYLTMTVVERESYVSDIPYDIEYTDTASLYKGDSKVTSAGVAGKADVVANVTYVNGEETDRQVLSSVTLANPVTEQRLRGTKERPTWLPTGTFSWPCPGNITSGFGYRHLSYSYASTYHQGIDIANRYGTAVCAADGGTVTYAGWMSGYGYLVEISHGNGYTTRYGHNSSLLVSVGQHVYKGQQVARMGSTGNSTGNHCHFEVRYNGVAKNPLKYLP